MNLRPPTLYWHDYETTGADTRRDRPLQFAGLRTDLDLEPVEEPVVLHCRPPADLLPAPVACAVTGISPRTAHDLGVGEAEFAAAVLEALGQPNTCGVGYNSLRFDDEITRHLLWRNLYDPYGREWREGNSRWDVIDLFRLARALRPQGMEWPDHASGVPSFRLEDLAAANGIEHHAHDALGDVRATLGLTRRLRRAQPRLYDYVFQRRLRGASADLLRLDADEPVLHVSARYPASRGCIAPVAAVAWHPADRNGVIVADLSADIDPLLDRDAETLAAALFTPAAERDPASPEIPLTVVKLNQAPVVAPMNTLTPEAERRLGFDTERARNHLRRLRCAGGLAERLREVFTPPARETGEDADAALYEGFVSDVERALMDTVHQCAPEGLAGFDPGFTDPRLRELYFRYRARNWPATLDSEERERWRRLRWHRICRGEAGSPRSLDAYREELASAVAQGRLAEAMREELAAWTERLLADLPPCHDPWPTE